MNRHSDPRQRRHRVFAHGFPGKYGGASTELHHQIKLWLAMDIEVHIIPSQVNYQNEPLYTELVQSGVIIHGCNQWEVLTAFQSYVTNSTAGRQLRCLHERFRESFGDMIARQRPRLCRERTKLARRGRRSRPDQAKKLADADLLIGQNRETELNAATSQWVTTMLKREGSHKT